MYELHHGCNNKKTSFPVGISVIRELKQRRRRRQQERQKSKKAMGLDRQDNNFARASRFFVHFFAVAAQVQREST